MPNKIIFISNTANFSKFNRPFMRWFKQQGWQVDYASTGEESVLDCDNQYSVCMERNPFSLKNIRSIKQLKIILDKEKYDIIHCHTNIGAMVARLAAKKLRKKGLKVIHTIHGAYFFKGAPLFNWCIYYLAEQYLSRYTDCLITINQEDYDTAIRKFKIPSIYKIDGVGIDLKKFMPVSKSEKNRLRAELGYDNNCFIILYIAEFVHRKNHVYLLRKIPEIKRVIPNLKVILAGKGILLDECKCIASAIGESRTVDFLGYRNDINILCQISDIHVSVSKMEGLSINNIEAMASGIPVVCSKIRGHTDVIVNGRNGFLFELNNQTAMINSIIKLYTNDNLRYEITKNNIDDVKKYTIDIVISKMAEIYKKFMHE
jgi:glycosyltransferase EpsD